MLIICGIKKILKPFFSVHIFFCVVSCIGSLNLIHTFVECTYYLYQKIQCLVFELNSYALTVFIAERRFVMILCSVPHLSPFLIWSMWNKRKFSIRSYIMSNHIHLHCQSLYVVCGVVSVTDIVGRSVRHPHPICVSIHAYVIQYEHISHIY